MQPRASIFGGSWINGSNAGSRYANVAYNWPENSNDNIGARGRSDDRIMTRRVPRSRRSATEAIPLDQDRWSARVSRFGEDTARSGIAGRRPNLSGCGSRPAAGFLFNEHFMAKRYRNLIGQIASPRNMLRAYQLTARGKRLSPGYLDFKEYDALNLDELAREMRNGTYVAGEPHEFYIFDPKRRLISALPFRDRVAQQAICIILGPIFDRAMLPRAFACREGKGTHAGVRLLQSDLRHLTRFTESCYFLKTDFSRYFASIELPTLWKLIEAKISCRATLRVLEAMIPRQGIGLSIGSLTSQIFANYYTGATLDRHLQQTLGEKHWYRYMDDLVVLGTSSEHLRKLKNEIERYSRHHLYLRFSKWQIAPISRGINFLGYRIWPTHKLLRRASVTRARRKLASYRAAGDRERERRFLAAWIGHAKHADAANLMRSLDIQSKETR